MAAVESKGPSDPGAYASRRSSLVVWNVADLKAATAAGVSGSGGRCAQFHRPLEHDVLFMTLMLD